MVHRNVPFSIGCVSAFIHGCMILFTIYALIGVSILMSAANNNHNSHDLDDDTATGIAFIGSFLLVILIISLIFEVGVFAVSVLLILGVQRDRLPFIASWIYCTGVYTVLSFIGLIKTTSGIDATFFIRIILIILHAAGWYPVFKYHRDMHQARSRESPGMCYTTPGTVYQPGPDGGNWQQGQPMPQCYPSPGYTQAYNLSPQVQQPLIHPQLSSSVNYPRQDIPKNNTHIGDNPPSYDNVKVGEDGEPLNRKI